MTAIPTINTVTELISTEAIEYIRQSEVKVKASLLRPNTRMFVFFDKFPADHLISVDGGVMGDPIVTDSNGEVSFTLHIPEMTYTTGHKEILITDIPKYDPNMAQTKASAIYHAEGMVKTYQETRTITHEKTVTSGKAETIVTTSGGSTGNVIVQPVQEITMLGNPWWFWGLRQSHYPEDWRGYDPLAQSFFTYGMVGGCYITSIELYFMTKDENAPVWVELRHMVNGYPSPVPVAPYARSIVYGKDVQISEDGSVPTKFVFDRLVYLEEDKDYCFVIRTASTSYNIFTARMGEVSSETGLPVLDQPYKGSVFKSENGVTWTAEQYEDIKFVLNRASFNTGVIGNLEFVLHPAIVLVESSQLKTTMGSDRIVLDLGEPHNLKADSKIGVWVNEGGTYNGIPSETLRGEFTVTRSISANEVEFLVPNAVADRTGSILTGGQLVDVVITNGGSGYVSPPTVSVIRNGGSGIDAIVTANVHDGIVTSVNIVNPGTGYENAPTIVFNSPFGVGAAGYAVNSPQVAIETNRIYHSITPMMDQMVPKNTMLTGKLYTTLGDYDGGPNIHYMSGNDYEIDLSGTNRFDNNLMACSIPNEDAFLGGLPSTRVSMTMMSENDNVSPIFDMNNTVFNGHCFVTNNQLGEDVNSDDSSGSLYLGSDGIIIVNEGMGYQTVPDVVITGTGTGATATCTVVGGRIATVTVTNGGSGYYGKVDVAFVGGSPEIEAQAVAVLTPFNSELNDDGAALTRYISLLQGVAQPSTGIKLFATAVSNVNSGFEFYIKPFMSSEIEGDEETIKWIKLDCDVPRNRSVSEDDFYDYEFYKYDLPEFDRYYIKIVTRTTTPWEPPRIINYRAIIVA